MKIKILLCILLTCFTLSGCSEHIAQTGTTGQGYILMVKEGSNSFYPDLTYGVAFEDFFASTEWQYFKSDTDEDIVEFTGECLFRDAEVKANLQFILDVETESFEIGALSLNDVPQDKLITAALMETIFERSAIASTDSEQGQDAGSAQYPQQNPSPNWSELSASDFLGCTTRDIIDIWGPDYTLTQTWSTQGIVYDDNPFDFHYISSGKDYISGDEIISIVRVYGDGWVNDRWRCGMSQDEIIQAADAEELLANYFSEDEQNATVCLNLETLEAYYSFEWYDGDTSLPCDLITIEQKI